MRVCHLATLVAAASLLTLVAQSALGNGGPFVVKYPTGDPAAKGVLARLDPTLKPARETRLRVEKEDLTFNFQRDKMFGDKKAPPLATVTATYTIENPTDEEVNVDFGFPILRGIYMHPLSMVPQPDVRVTVVGPDGKQNASRTIISNSIIYGIIRRNARAAIDKGIAADAELSKLVERVKAAAGKPVPQPLAQKQSAQPSGRESKPTADYAPAREALAAYLTKKLGWDQRDAALMVEYAGIDFGPDSAPPRARPRDRAYYHFGLDSAVANATLGPLGAIGEKKATQLFAQLAGRFDKNTATAYKAIFEAWGGDVRERSIDLGSGKIRPREFTVPKDAKPVFGVPRSDPAVYARVDFLDKNAKISDTEKAACRTILKNLPVVFTFAPMNLLHYQVTFPAKTKLVVTITYKQYAYTDTAEKPTYQFAYVLHPASLWDDFGPINLKIITPQGIACKTSVPTSQAKASESLATYSATLDEAKYKRGEMFIALDKTAWDEKFKKNVPKVAATPTQPTPE